MAKKSKTVQWISLPDKDGKVKAKSVCSVAGWGRNKTSGVANNLLLQADVVIKEKKECKKFWNGYFTERMVCAGGEAGFCQVRFHSCAAFIQSWANVDVIYKYI